MMDWQAELELAAEQMLERLEIGAQEYGDESFHAKSELELLEDQRQEVIDDMNYGLMRLIRINRQILRARELDNRQLAGEMGVPDRSVDWSEF